MGVENPGPGNYNVNTHCNCSSGGFGFGTSTRSNFGKEATPGPGHYKVPCKVADVPRYAYPARSEQFKFV